MDVGSANFRFTLDDPEAKAVTTRHPKTAELHLDSLDRYTVGDIPVLTPNVVGADQNTAKLFGSVFAPIQESATKDCIIQTRRNLIYGYMSRVALTQFNLNYNVPTVVAGYNDLFSLVVGSTPVYYTIPAGWYNVVTLAAALQVLIRATPGGLLSAATVTPPTSQVSTITTSVSPGFVINSGSALLLTTNPGVTGQTVNLFNNYGRVWRMLGINNQVPSAILTFGTPNLRPTDYVDIVSRSLTNYKDTKDANSSIQSPGSVIGRIWLTESNVNGQTAANGYPDPNLVGTAPLTIVKNWINPNWSQWSPNQAINTVDITLLDMWGNPLYWTPTSPTEWSATLTVTE